MGFRLEAGRVLLGLTQKAPADQASVSPRMVSEVEHGHRQSLLAESLLGLADALEVSPHWLLYGLGRGKRSEVPEEVGASLKVFEGEYG